MIDKKVASKDRIDKDIIEVYHQIDLNIVVEEYILYKGIECVKSVAGLHNHLVGIKELIPTALYKYSLKNNSTNILNVDVILTRQAKQSGNFYYHNNKCYLSLDLDFYNELSKKDFDFRHPRSL